MTRAALLALMLAACTEHGSTPHYTLQVTAVPGLVQVYRPDVDLCCTATEPFPAPGSCVESTNTSTCRPCAEPSCFDTFELVRGDGTAITSNAAGASNKTSLIVPGNTTFVMLVARGCGDDVSVPIAIGAGPQPDLVSTYRADGTVETSWTTDRPAATAIVSAGLQACQTADTSHEFIGFSGTGTLSTSVSTFDPPIKTAASTNVDLVVYSGGRAGLLVMPQ